MPKVGEAEIDGEFIAWAAGFFDGEGCVLIVRLSTGTTRLGVDVTQVDPAPLLELQATFGGTVTFFDRKRSGTRGAHRWRCHGRLAVAFLAAVRPHLRVKAAQADAGLRYGSTIVGSGNRLPPDLTVVRGGLRAELHDLNRRGIG